ncbi:major facilitator family transporter [Caballeronia temeraria]|uniref:Major facilitator family transporter n=1 Tax=Caballeronia temeraria TaxID=1777137 RepID=A0A158DTF0_9BURK|nr:MFS transporter [Caballeronia temeraria]SAK97803.1 major facilitator family transporter [Caballeronia temeraria]
MQRDISMPRESSRRWYRDITWTQWRVLIAAWGVWVNDALDFLAITFVLRDIATAFHVSLDTASLLLLATYGVRWIGGLLFGGLSDRIGRKIPLLITLTWFTLGAVATGLSWNFIALAVFRLLLGFGMAPGFSLGAAMVAESWPEKHRAIGIGILDTGWGVGAIGAALAYEFIYPHFGWRGMFFIGLPPSVLLALFIIFCVPESQAWQKSRPARAVRWRSNPVVDLFSKYPKRVSYLALLIFVLCFGSWPFQALLPTYLRAAELAPSAVSQITMASAVGQILGFIASGFIAERLGRRNAISLMIAIGALFVAGVILSVGNIALAAACSFASGFFLIGSSGIWGTILTENLPRDVRASGVGFLYNFGVIGGGIAPFIVLSTMHRFDFPMPYAIIGFTLAAAVAGMIVIRFVRETKGLSLDEVDREGGH